MNNNMIRFALILVVTASIATAGVALVFSISKPRIDEKRKETRQEAVAVAFNMELAAFRSEYALEPLVNESAPNAPEDCWRVVKKDAPEETLGYAATGEAGGYGGRVKVVVAVRYNLEKKAFELVGVMVYEQKETPGLGTKILEKEPSATWYEGIAGTEREEKKNAGPLDEYIFLRQFRGRTEGELKVVKGDEPGIRAITGATISSRAVINAARDAWSKITARAKFDPVTGATSH